MLFLLGGTKTWVLLSFDNVKWIWKKLWSCLILTFLRWSIDFGVAFEIQLLRFSFFVVSRKFFGVVCTGLVSLNSLDWACFDDAHFFQTNVFECGPKQHVRFCGWFIAFVTLIVYLLKTFHLLGFYHFVAVVAVLFEVLWWLGDFLILFLA